jgi:superoxide reductase
MEEIKNLYQKADWKKEKHVPVIEILNEPKKNEFIKVEISVGKEIAHPNTTAHHICWIDVYFLPKGEKFPYQLGKMEFLSHGASVDGADKSTIYTHPLTVINFMTQKDGIILATSYCNIHGLWENSLELKL